MLKPADGIEGVKEAILTAVKDAGPNACPPMVVGVGIGGTFEQCAGRPAICVGYVSIFMASAVCVPPSPPGPIPNLLIFSSISFSSSLTYGTGLPVAVNMCCHVNRHAHRVI